MGSGITPKVWASNSDTAALVHLLGWRVGGYVWCGHHSVCVGGGGWGALSLYGLPVWPCHALADTCTSVSSMYMTRCHKWKPTVAFHMICGIFPGDTCTTVGPRGGGLPARAEPAVS
jgi:hypothetical protein